MIRVMSEPPAHPVPRPYGFGYFENIPAGKLAVELLGVAFIWSGGGLWLHEAVTTGVARPGRRSFFGVATWNDRPLLFASLCAVMTLLICAGAVYLVFFGRAVLRRLRHSPGGVSLRRRYRAPKRVQCPGLFPKLRN